MHFVVLSLIVMVATAAALPTNLTVVTDEPAICDLFYSYSLKNGRCNGDEKLPVPCKGWCHMYIQCENGMPASKGTNCDIVPLPIPLKVFDYVTRECEFKEWITSGYCDWWKNISITTSTTTTQFPATTPSAAQTTELATTPSTAPSTAAPTKPSTAAPTITSDTPPTEPSTESTAVPTEPSTALPTEQSTAPPPPTEPSTTSDAPPTTVWTSPTTRHPPSSARPAPFVWPPSPVPSVCSSEWASLLIPAPGRCDHYVVCFLGRSLTMPCPAPLHFHYTLQACDWPANAGCA